MKAYSVFLSHASARELRSNCCPAVQTERSLAAVSGHPLLAGLAATCGLHERPPAPRQKNSLSTNLRQNRRQHGRLARPARAARLSLSGKESLQIGGDNDRNVGAIRQFQ